MLDVPPDLARLEREFGEWIGLPAAVATGYGRSALFLALETLEVAGHDVLVPDFVCAQVPAAVRKAGARPVFFRVNRDLEVSPESLRAAITGNSRAAILVHYYGRVLSHFPMLVEVCRQRSIGVIEDCALALGARGGDGRLAGVQGDLAVFSFTKSDWCYGGGMLAASSPKRGARARAIRDAKFVSDAGRALCYGLLRRADFAANRPSYARMAGVIGSGVERMAGSFFPPLRGTNFYEAAGFDRLMSPRAARRALRILRALPATLRQQRAAMERIRSALASRAVNSGGLGLLFSTPAKGASSAFLLLLTKNSDAGEMRDPAARAGVTLRLAWPAFQEFEPGQKSQDVLWLGERLLVLEVHTRLRTEEAVRIADVLAGLS